MKNQSFQSWTISRNTFAIIFNSSGVPRHIELEEGFKIHAKRIKSSNRDRYLHLQTSNGEEVCLGKNEVREFGKFNQSGLSS